MILWLIVVAICLLAYCLAKFVGTVPSLRTIWMFNKLPGPDNLPFFFGITLDLSRMDSTEVLSYTQKGFEKYGSWYAVYDLGFPKIICIDPEFIKEKVYQEQIEIFGSSGRDPTKADLSKMHYLDQVIKESLRLHPPVPQISRELKEDVKLTSGHIIPAGTLILINNFLTHRNPKYWDEPEVFNPERFSLDSSKDRHPYSYIPFSAGPRNCIGQKFAMMVMKIGVSTILRSCKITAVTRSQDFKYAMFVTLHPNTPIKVELHHRNQ